VLANSNKPGGRCIAGKELIRSKNDKKWKLTENWIRPVSDDVDNHGSVSQNFYQLDGQDIYLMDIVTIGLIKHSPAPGQPENWMIDPSFPWESEDVFAAKKGAKLLETHSDIWLDRSNGEATAEVSFQYEQQGFITDSLKMIQPVNLQLHLSNDYNNYQQEYKKKMTASFEYNGVGYSGLSVTDPIIKRILGKQYPEEGQDENVTTLTGRDAYWLCVSLGPRFGDQKKHYKLVAGVIDQSGYLLRRYK